MDDYSEMGISHDQNDVDLLRPRLRRYLPYEGEDLVICTDISHSRPSDDRVESSECNPFWQFLNYIQDNPYA